MIPFVDLKAQYLRIKDEIDAAIAEVVESCHFVLGEQVEAFESDFARFCETEHALGVNSGTSALHLALLAAGVKAGDEVITVSDTFVATAAAICYTGARPVFVEIEPRLARWIQLSLKLRLRRAPKWLCRSISMAAAPIWIRFRNRAASQVDRDRRCSASSRRRIQRKACGQPGRHRLFQFLSGQKPGSLRRRRRGCD